MRCAAGFFTYSTCTSWHLDLQHPHHDHGCPPEPCRSPGKNADPCRSWAPASLQSRAAAYSQPCVLFQVALARAMSKPTHVRNAQGRSPTPVGPPCHGSSSARRACGMCSRIVMPSQSSVQTSSSSYPTSSTCLDSQRAIHRSPSTSNSGSHSTYCCSCAVTVPPSWSPFLVALARADVSVMLAWTIS